MEGGEFAILPMKTARPSGNCCVDAHRKVAGHLAFLELAASWSSFEWMVFLNGSNKDQFNLRCRLSRLIYPFSDGSKKEKIPNIN